MDHIKETWGKIIRNYLNTIRGQIQQLVYYNNQNQINYKMNPTEKYKKVINTYISNPNVPVASAISQSVNYGLLI